VWATERFDPTTNDFEAFVHGYLERPDRSIDSPPPGPVPTFAYGSAIFFEFLTERHDDDLIRKLWEHLENGQGDPMEPADQADPTFVVQLDALLRRDYGSSFAAEWAEFAKWNLYTGVSADPAVAYAEGARYPAVTSSAITLPHQMDGLRVFYASAQYFVASAGGRTRVTAAMVDSQLTTTDDTNGMVLWLASRKMNRNAEVVRVTNGETVDVTGGSAIVVVTNTNRGPIGAALSNRPALCVGTPDEVNTCIVAFGGTLPDAGVDAGVDAGTDAGSGEPDAGMAADAGPEPMGPPTGCGCGVGIESSPLWLVLLALGRRFFLRR
jgi:MYXO-CTERM domain-containing protein